MRILRHLWTSPLFLACVAAVLLTACRKQDMAAPEAVDSPGRSVVYDSMSKNVDPTALESMRWKDVAPTAEACARHGLVDEALKVSKSLAPPPVIYLRGLLLFSKDDAQSAANEWARLDVAAIPPDFLYAPWRLVDSFKPEWNRYEAALVRAVNEKTVSPLVRARYLGGQGDWREALESYLLTDPSAWTPFDVRMFAIMKLQAPCSHDVQVLVSGALAGGRVSERLRGDLARLIRSTPEPDKQQLEAVLKNDPDFAKAATDAASDALALRQAFASNQFQQVLELSTDADPLLATDEEALLAFLSAAQLKEQTVMKRWADELLRRNPNEKTQTWITNIQAEAQ